MTTNPLTPEAMTVICNIQAMKKTIDITYSAIKDFKRLENRNIEELRKEQEELMPKYNKAFMRKYKEAIK